MTENNDKLQQLQALDSAHHFHPFTNQGELHEMGTRVISRADGVYLWEANGRRLLDGMAGLWCVNIGYGRQELAQVAFAQMQELPYYNSFFQCTNEPAIKLAAKLSEITPPHMNHTLFGGSGSDANDMVLRIARHFWACQGEPMKSVIISRRNAYHGSTVAGASLGGMADPHKQGDLPIPGIVHIDQPYWFGEGGDEDPSAFGLRVAQQLEEKILQLGVNRVAAFIGEPIQGAGGVVIPPDSYWPEIQRICDKYGILLAVDEVICGFGRTGRWFGTDYYGLKPDFMTMAKGLSSGYLPISAVMLSDRVSQVMEQQGGEMFMGYTYSGHPVSAAVALKNLEIMQQEKLVERTGDITGPYLQQRLSELSDHPLVGETRSVGLVGAVELVKDKATRSRYPGNGKVGLLCRNQCIEHGLVMRAVGDTMILSPPLIITEAQIDELVEKARLALDATAEAIAKNPPTD